MTALSLPASTSSLRKARSPAFSLGGLRPVAAKQAFFRLGPKGHNFLSRTDVVGMVVR